MKIPIIETEKGIYDQIEKIFEELDEFKIALLDYFTTMHEKEHKGIEVDKAEVTKEMYDIITATFNLKHKLENKNILVPTDWEQKMLSYQNDPKRNYNIVKWVEIK